MRRNVNASARGLMVCSKAITLVEVMELPQGYGVAAGSNNFENAANHGLGTLLGHLMQDLEGNITFAAIVGQDAPQSLHEHQCYNT
eukprot:4655635-Amphidinium_carterae.1